MTMGTSDASIAEAGELIGILRRRRWFILATVILGTALVGGGAFLLPPRYTAKAQLVVEPRLSSLIGGQPAVIEQEPDQATLMTQLAAIKSHDLLARVLDSLAKEPSLRASVSHADDKAALLRQQMWARLSDWMPRIVLKWLSGPTWLTLPLLERHLNVFQELGSHVIAITYTSSNPQEAALIANRVTKAFLTRRAAEQRASVDNALAWFDRRLPELAKQMQQLNTQLERYQTAQGLGDTSHTNLTDQRIADISRELSSAEAELAARQARYDAARALQTRDGGKSLRETLNTPALEDLRRRETELMQTYESQSVALSDNNPRIAQIRLQAQIVRQEIARSIQAALAGLASETQAAAAQVNTLRQQLTALQNASTDAGLHALVREAASTRHLYETLEQRREELREQREGLPPTVQLLSMAAIPERPSSASPVLFIPPAIVLFAMGGAFGAVLLDRLDTTLHSEREIADKLRLPCIGLVPQLRRVGRQRLHHYLLEWPFAPYSESIRSVVAGLRLALPQRAASVILVTSALPGEGKTSLAVSLAVYAAQLRRRVLLIDMDFRHPAVLEELGGTAEPGAADPYLHDRPAAEYIRHFPDLRLDCLPLRRGLGVDPVKLFASQQLPHLLEQLRSRYDCIVIDSAPLMAVTETRLLASLADTVLLAVRWGSTRHEVARNAAAFLTDPLSYQGEPPPRVVAALTRVDIKKHARYRYGDSGEFLAGYAKYSTIIGKEQSPLSPPYRATTPARRERQEPRS